jgi:hypothetical protein
MTMLTSSNVSFFADMFLLFLPGCSVAGQGNGRGDALRAALCRSTRVRRAGRSSVFVAGGDVCRTSGPPPAWSRVRSVAVLARSVFCIFAGSMAGQRCLSQPYASPILVVYYGVVF